MPKISKQSATKVDDFGVAEDRHDDLDGYTRQLRHDPSGPRPRADAERPSRRELPVPALGITSSRVA